MDPRTVFLLSVGLLVGGCGATISAKAVDKEGFAHPFYQVLFMFFGEVLCLAFAKCELLVGGGGGGGAGRGSKRAVLVDEEATVERSSLPWWTFAVPAALDLVGSALVYEGLRHTSASKFQMIRCVLVPFTAFASFVFLYVRPKPYQLFSMVFVVLAVVAIASNGDTGGNDAEGEADVEEDASQMLMGNMFIVLSQVAIACQLVWEERMFKTSSLSPLSVVGTEGKYGVVFTLLVLLFLELIEVESVAGVMKDMESGVITMFLLCNMFSVAMLNAFGFGLMMAASSSHRVVIDTLRIILIWTFSFMLGWESSLSSQQLLSFFILVFGICAYNRIILFACFSYQDANDPTLQQQLLDDDDDGGGGVGQTSNGNHYALLGPSTNSANARSGVLVV